MWEDPSENPLEWLKSKFAQGELKLGLHKGDVFILSGISPEGETVDAFFDYNFLSNTILNMVENPKVVEGEEKGEVVMALASYWQISVSFEAMVNIFAHSILQRVLKRHS